jgi:hypothetical protein
MSVRGPPCVAALHTLPDRFGSDGMRVATIPHRAGTARAEGMSSAEAERSPFYSREVGAHQPVDARDIRELI